MKLAPFLLDKWLDDHEHVSPKFHLGGSTRPRWTVGEVLDLDAGSRDRLFGATVVYPPAAGAATLREAIASHDGIDPQHVLSWRVVRKCYVRSSSEYTSASRDSPCMGASPHFAPREFDHAGAAH
jgi:hypothetical protein